MKSSIYLCSIDCNFSVQLSRVNARSEIVSKYMKILTEALAYFRD
jgi:hypothetical protein